MRKVATKTTWIVLIAGFCLLGWQSSTILGAFFFVPFALGPLILQLWFARIWPSRVSDRILAVAAIAYAAWFGYVYWDAFHAHLDPQSSIAMVFVGIWALPGMCVFWLCAFFFRKRAA